MAFRGITVCTMLAFGVLALRETTLEVMDLNRQAIEIVKLWHAKNEK